MTITLTRDQRTFEIHQGTVAGDPFLVDQWPRETHQSAVDENPFPPATVHPEPRSLSLAGTFSSPDAMVRTEPMLNARRGMILYNPYLCLLSDSLDDIEALRIATDNRVRALTRNEEDSDGEMRGLGLDARSPEVSRSMALAENIQALEHQATLDLQREVKRSPLYGWVARNKGVGAKQAGRLFAVIGDPYWNDLHDRPRTVSELWAYAGYAVHFGHADRRAKGQKNNWNDKAKSRAFLMAQSCIKRLDGEYRKVYDAAREQYADAIHPHDCTRCGPKGKPALEGSPLSLGHQHARALRRVSKEILKDLWLEAKAIHESEAV